MNLNIEKDLYQSHFQRFDTSLSGLSGVDFFKDEIVQCVESLDF